MKDLYNQRYHKIESLKRHIEIGLTGFITLGINLIAQNTTLGIITGSIWTISTIAINKIAIKPHKQAEALFKEHSSLKIGQHRISKSDFITRTTNLKYKNPFIEDDAEQTYVEILDIKNGWVKWIYNFQHKNDNSFKTDKTNDFVEQYPFVINQTREDKLDIV